jgi:aerobic-type carbon monoxide dehydrogenase small subunit (CoxS/CutS family)
VLVDGQPRVACVTPARRVRGRSITTLDGLPAGELAAWGSAFCAAGASQCGFCTPGIIVRLAGLATRSPEAGEPR